MKTNFLTNNNSKLKYTSEINNARIFEFNLYTNSGSATIATYLFARGYRLG